MSDKTETILDDYELVAGDLALDFCNTMGGGRETDPKEYLRSYDHLVKWGLLVGLISKKTADSLTRAAASDPAAANEVLLRAIALREAFYRAITALTNKKQPSQEDLFVVAREAGFAVLRARFTKSGEGYAWSWAESSDLDQLLWPVAKAAADLFTSERMRLVRECGSETCTWVFLDTSKNHRRRWCTMSDCGNREKVRRFRRGG